MTEKLVVSKDLGNGAWIWKNWKRYQANEALLGMVEVELFTDAWIIGETSHGPYSFLNGVPFHSHEGQYDFKPSIVLRISHFVDVNQYDMSKTDKEHYHGGWIYDEIAALASLVLGARIVAGPVSRQFESRNDPFGTPQTHAASVLPTLPPRIAAPIIPWLFESRNLAELSQLKCLTSMSGKASEVLVKSARLFQQALYVCDFAPEISWLLLVSSIETAAAHWDADLATEVDRLTSSYPGLVALLSAQSNESLVSDVAKHLAKLTGATSKFRGFCKRYRATPPEERPEFGQFDFQDEAYDAAIKTIYDLRSQALHSGIPFPYPMCIPPRQLNVGSKITAERPLGLAAGGRGATWQAKDTPMHLHLFAHIVRKTLLNWWASMISDDKHKPAAGEGEP